MRSEDACVTVVMPKVASVQECPRYLVVKRMEARVATNGQRGGEGYAASRSRLTHSWPAESHQTIMAEASTESRECGSVQVQD